MHVLVPEYVPLIVEFETLLAAPITLAEQLGSPTILPTGTNIENVRVEPDNVPEIVPLKTVEPSSVLAMMVPETFAPACVRFQTIVPGPDESEADPE